MGGRADGPERLGCGRVWGGGVADDTWEVAAAHGVSVEAQVRETAREMTLDRGVTPAVVSAEGAWKLLRSMQPTEQCRPGVIETRDLNLGFAVVSPAREAGLERAA